MFFQIQNLQEWKDDAELKARVMAHKAFLVWPANGEGKDKRATSMAIKLNKLILKPLVGRADIEPKLGGVPVLQPLLQSLVSAWSVSLHENLATFGHNTFT